MPDGPASRKLRWSRQERPKLAVATIVEPLPPTEEMKTALACFAELDIMVRDLGLGSFIDIVGKDWDREAKLDAIQRLSAIPPTPELIANEATDQRSDEDQPSVPSTPVWGAATAPSAQLTPIAVISGTSATEETYSPVRKAGCIAEVQEIVIEVDLSPATPSDDQLGSESALPVSRSQDSPPASNHDKPGGQPVNQSPVMEIASCIPFVTVGDVSPTGSEEPPNGKSSAVHESALRIATAQPAAKTQPGGRPLPEGLRRFFELQPMDTDDVGTRNLLSARLIDKISQAPGSPNMQIATIGGWNVVINRGQSHAGDLVLFAEPDSFLPARVTAFQTKDHLSEYEGEWGWRLKCVKVGRQHSQGAIFRIDAIPEVRNVVESLVCYHGGLAQMKEVIGQYHFAPLVGVKRWFRAPETQELRGQAQAFLGTGRPPFVRETGARRVQNCPNLFKKAKYWNRLYQETQKMDGESMSVYFVLKSSPAYASCHPLPPVPGRDMVHANGRFGICSHRREINDTAAQGRFWETARVYDLPRKLAQLDRSIVIQGELCGWGINENLHGFARGEYDWFVFDAIDIDPTGGLLRPAETFQLATELCLRHVPVREHKVTVRSLAKDYEDLFERARSTNREGLVYKNVADASLRFKVINDRYLLKHDE